MLTLKKIKSLPTSLDDTKKVTLSLESNSVFMSDDGRKFSYFKFKNIRNATCFFFVVEIKEFNASGTLLREGKLFFPNIYLPSNDTLENEYPFELDSDTGWITLKLVYAEFESVHYYKENIYNVLSKEMILETRAMPMCKDSKKEAKEITPPAPETNSNEEEKPIEEPANETVDEPFKEEEQELIQEPVNDNPSPIQEEKEPNVLDKEEPVISVKEEEPADSGNKEEDYEPIDESTKAIVATPIHSHQGIISIIAFLVFILTLALIAFSMYSKASDLSNYYYMRFFLRG